MNLFDLTGKLALVTGSTRGLGLTYAEGLAAAGADIVVHGRRQDAAEAAAAAIAERYGVRTDTVLFDVADAAAAEAAIEDLVARVGVPDILVNNAGIQRRAPFHEMAVADWDDVIATNLSSVFYVSRIVARHMVPRGSGKIVNIGSVTSLLARQTIAPYTAAKGGVGLLSKAMAADLARYNIQVNTISPGYYRTEMNAALIADPVFDAWVCQETPAGRWGDPDELLGALVFLTSEASSYVSGQNIFVDGGMTSTV